MKPIDEMFNGLLKVGCSYRYSQERWAELSQGGQPYPSPTQLVETAAGQLIEELMQPVLEPIVLDEEIVRPLGQLAKTWPKFMASQLNLFRLARDQKLEGRDIAMIRGMCTSEEWIRGLVDPGYRVIHPFVRLDAVLTNDGFKVIDINTTRPAGVGDIIAHYQAMNGKFDQGLSLFPTGSSFAGVVKKCVDDWASAKNLPGESIPMAMVVRQTDGDWRNFENLNRAIVRAGLNSRLVEPDELMPGEMTAIIRSRIKEGDPAFGILAGGYPDERCVLSPLYRRFLGNKLWMYFFRQPPFKDFFKAALGDAYQLLDEYFPAIGMVRDGYVQFPNEALSLDSLGHQEWVLKDPASSSGRRMYLGCFMSKKKWQELLTEVRPGWIAQRFYKVTQRLTVADERGEPVIEKLFTKYGIYIFDSELAGIEFMARKMPVVHGARNTYWNPVYQRKSAV